MGDDWRRYPFELTPGDPHFVFPAAEADHPGCESDTWYLAGELAAASGRRFAFFTIYNKNRPGLALSRSSRARPIVADFYTLAMFDLDAGTYGTYTDYDMPGTNRDDSAPPKLSMSDEHLDLAYDCSAGTAVWRTSRDERGELVPYTYEFNLFGIDHHGETMQLELSMTPSRPPVPLGAAAYNGVIECFGQATTYSYFQTRMSMTGTLSWGSVHETVTGSAGHVDRQWFPLVANDGGATGDIRSRGHEWRTINLDNGVDISIWRQFDRTKNNAPQPFTGATVSAPDGGPEYADDIEVAITSYVRWPDEIRTLVPPPAKDRYLSDRHRLTSRKLDLDLTAEPLVAAPAHLLPLEYMAGPYRYEGTYRGERVDGFAFYERSMALYREWELKDVLAAAEPGQRDEVVRLIDVQR